MTPPSREELADKRFETLERVFDATLNVLFEKDVISRDDVQAEIIRQSLPQENHYGHNIDVTTDPAYCSDCEVSFTI